ncbi:MAG: thiamine phosphate synthase [Boseongicola sp.]
MADPERPQLYLVTPPEFELSTFPDRLAGVMDAHDIGCVRLTLATQDEDRISRAADALREITHSRDVALVIDTHVAMAAKLGLDGVHLTDGARSVRKSRKALGAEAIIGSYCGASKHDGINAGEAGADYVAFGRAGGTSLGDGTQADPALFKWWSEMIEVPVVAEGALDINVVQKLVQFVDFFAIGEEIWRTDDAVKALAVLAAALK